MMLPLQAVNVPLRGDADEMPPGLWMTQCAERAARRSRDNPRGEFYWVGVSRDRIIRAPGPMHLAYAVKVCYGSELQKTHQRMQRLCISSQGALKTPDRVNKPPQKSHAATRSSESSPHKLRSQKVPAPPAVPRDLLGQSCWVLVARRPSTATRISTCLHELDAQSSVNEARTKHKCSIKLNRYDLLTAGDEDQCEASNAGGMHLPSSSHYELFLALHSLSFALSQSFGMYSHRFRPRFEVELSFGIVRQCSLIFH
jgi:hypothetical protein